MQWIGETIDTPISGSLDPDLDQVTAPFGRDLLHVLQAMQEGDFSIRMATGFDGLSGQIADAVNLVAAANQRVSQQLECITAEIRDGRTRQRVRLGLPGRGWSEMENHLNRLVDDLLWPTTAVTRAVAAVGNGDLTQTVALDIDGRSLKGDFLEMAAIVNATIRQLGLFAAEMTRVAREIGTEGKLGAQAQIADAAGVWNTVAESINAAARSVSAQIRNATEVTAAVSNGDFSKKMSAEVRGEALQLKETINAMVDRLRSAVMEMTRVVREVGVEGQFGSRAVIPDAAGAWRDLAGGINHLAAGLTVQHRAGSGCPARPGADPGGVVPAGGTLPLRAEASVIDRNVEQDWLRTNLARLTALLQRQRDPTVVGRVLLSELIPLVKAKLGAIYRVETSQSVSYLKVLATCADDDDDGSPSDERIRSGVGLIGQCAMDKRRLLMTEMPAGAAAVGFSMLKVTPHNVIAVPVLFGTEIKAIIELASLSAFTPLQITFLEQITVSVGVVLHAIDAATLAEDQLRQSRALACELQARQIALQETAAELERRLADGTAELERSRSLLQDSEDSRILALAAGKMGSWDWDLTTGCCLWDSGQRQIFGEPASFDVTLSKVRARLDRSDWKLLCRQLRRARRRGGAWQLEFRVRRADGSVRWCLGTAVAARDSAGRVARIRGITMDITERKEAEERQSLLAREVDHRTKNALAVVHAIVSLTRADDVEQFSAAVEGRIQVLARAHSLLSDSRWHGAKIADLIQGELSPLRAAGPERVQISGRSLTLHPSAVQALALTIHELAANAVQHGALSMPSGRIHVAWEQQGDELALRWSESGAGLQPMDGPVRKGPVKEGLGMRIIRASVETQLCGTAEFDWRPDGLCCEIRVPCHHPKSQLLGSFLHSIQAPGDWKRRQALS